MLPGFSDGSFPVPSRAINVAGFSVNPIEIDGVRYTTLAQIDQVHARNAGVADQSFRSNRDRFREGQDLKTLSYRDLQKSGVPNPSFLRTVAIISIAIKGFIERRVKKRQFS